MILLPDQFTNLYKSLPCVFAERNKGYQIGETFFIKDYGESHIDFTVSDL